MKINVIIPVIVEKKIPTGEVDVARPAEFPNAQALADFANQTSSALVEVKVVPVEAEVAQTVAQAATESAEEARQQSSTPHTTSQQSPSRESAEWTIVDDVEKWNASTVSSSLAKKGHVDETSNFSEKTWDVVILVLLTISVHLLN